VASGLTSGLVPRYRDVTVLVTGHTGIKGAWLTAWLKAMGARVIGYALPPEHGASSLYEAAKIGDGVVSIFGDVRNAEGVAEVLQRHRPEVVFHLAAQALVRRSYREPVLSYETNVMGTVHVLEAARRTPSVSAVVVVTSDKCYGDQGLTRGYRETDPMSGDDPYSSSKGCAELVVTAYRRSFCGDGPALASARAGNVIAGGDWAEDRLVPDIVRAVAAGRPVVLRHPTAVRPWQHVLDPLAGYLLLGAQLREQGAAFAEAWNFGPTDEETVTVRELVERMRKDWDSVEVAPSPSVAEGLAETQFLRLDPTKARTRLGWSPRLTLSEAIAWTVEWYHRFLDDPKAAPRLVAQQLAAYDERLGAVPAGAATKEAGL